MSKLLSALTFIFIASFANASASDANVLKAANDSAATFLINGKIDSALAKAFAVLDNKGMQDSSKEDKAFAILEANAAN